VVEPEFRCGTGKAIASLATKLDVEYNDFMQDWSYEIANPNEIEKYIELYKNLRDEEEKFVLMETIIQATEEQNGEKLFLNYLNIVKNFLEIDFHIHKYTIYYWACFDTEDIEDCFKISVFMRELLIDQQKP